MPIDPNEAPEWTLAVEHPGPTCPGEICIFYGKKQCADQKCYGDDRKDKTGCYFIKKPQPTETKTMEDEYEYIVADSAENCAEIFRWIKEGDTFHFCGNAGWNFTAVIYPGDKYRRKKPQTDVFLTDPKEIARGILAGVVECMQGIVWLHATVHDSQFIATKLGLGLKYRLKPGCKLPPKKTKKLVPRTPEEFWPLIGRWWCRHKKDNFRSIIQSDRLSCQDEWEIAPLGTEEWQPMMKEIEVEE